MSPRTEEQNSQIKDERREQILSAALKIFSTRGFAATKISDIIAESNISHGLLYHYFSSKEEMFYVLVRRAVDTAVQSLLMVENLPLPPLEKVRQTRQIHFAWHQCRTGFILLFHDCCAGLRIGRSAPRKNEIP